MKRILITAIGGDIGSAVLRCLRNLFEDSYLVGCDIREFNQGLEYIDTFYLAPPYTDKRKYLDFIYEICDRERINYFFPIAEKEIEIIANNKEYFSKHGIKTLINEINVLDICLSKYKTACFLEANGINSPKTYKQSELPQDLEFPLIVKAEYGCGSHSIAKVCNKEELKDAFNKIPNAVVQKYVGKNEDEYTVGVFSDGKVIRSIAFKRELGPGGLSVLVETIQDEKIEIISKKIALAFNLHGCINVQMRKENNQYYIFEINPRLSSTVGFRHMLGFEDIKWWIELLDNECVVSTYRPIQKDVIGIKKQSDLVFDKKTKGLI